MVKFTVNQTNPKLLEAMEEVMNFIMRAFELAKNLELELPNMANHPEMLFSSIDDVEKAFNAAKERVRMMLSSQHDTTTTKPSNTFAQILSHDVFMQKTQHAQIGGSGSAISMHAHSMDQLLLMQHPFDVSVLLENKMISGGGDGGDVHLLRSRGTLRIGEMGGRDLEGLDRSKGLGDQMQGIETPPSRPKKWYVYNTFMFISS